METPIENAPLLRVGGYYVSISNFLRDRALEIGAIEVDPEFPEFYRYKEPSNA